jgi:small subunit ribosomal protein S8
MMTDPIADMLTRIRNASAARHEKTLVPASTLKKNIAEILKLEGFIADVKEEDAVETGRKVLTIVLKYGRDREGAIDGIRRVSKPGRRVYVRHDRIPRVLSGLGVSILSTSRGVMSDKEARKQKLGGELICEVWLWLLRKSPTSRFAPRASASARSSCPRA